MGHKLLIGNSLGQSENNFIFALDLVWYFGILY